MQRLVLLLLLLFLAPARAETAGPLRTEPAVAFHGPQGAPGALLWMHGGYFDGPPPEAPPFLRQVAAEGGWDLWRLDRPSFKERADVLATGAARLSEGVQALRAQGYRQLAIVGESRGAFVTLIALAEPRLADAVLLLAPAAHGPRPERRPEAMADWYLALARMAPDAARRLGLVQFTGDPYDPGPEARRDSFAAAAGARHIPTLTLFHPQAPEGHGGMWDESFPPRFGPCLAAFLDLRQAMPGHCPEH